MPLHPLVVHAAVVFVPLAALAVIAFAVLPRWRWLSRWPAVLLTLVALASVWVSRLSGKSLADELQGIERLIETHEERGELLSLLMIGFTVLALLGAWALGGPSALVSGAGARESRVAALDVVLPALLVVASLVVLVMVVLTGDAGSRVVWG
jgi:cation transporter-like permease